MEAKGPDNTLALKMGIFSKCFVQAIGQILGFGLVSASQNFQLDEARDEEMEITTVVTIQEEH